MALDYVLQFPCEVRNNFPEAKLLAMVKHKAIAEFAVSKFKQAYPDSDVDTILNKCLVEIAVKGPDGTARQTPVPVGQIISMIKPLEQVKGNCTECRANVADRSFGCIGKINYPITSESEEWLLSRLPDDAKGPSLSLLFKFISDLEIDGKPVDPHRSRTQMFESKTPSARKWGGWIGKKEITSSQLLHMLAFGGTIGAEQARLYTKLLSLSSVLSEQHPPSDIIEQFKTFMCAIVMAGRLNANILIDA